MTNVTVMSHWLLLLDLALDFVVTLQQPRASTGKSAVKLLFQCTTANFVLLRHLWMTQ